MAPVDWCRFDLLRSVKQEYDVFRLDWSYINMECSSNTTAKVAWNLILFRIRVGRCVICVHVSVHACLKQSCVFLCVRVTLCILVLCIVCPALYTVCGPITVQYFDCVGKQWSLVVSCSMDTIESAFTATLNSEVGSASVTLWIAAYLLCWPPKWAVSLASIALLIVVTLSILHCWLHLDTTSVVSLRICVLHCDFHKALRSWLWSRWCGWCTPSRIQLSILLHLDTTGCQPQNLNGMYCIVTFVKTWVPIGKLVSSCCWHSSLKFHAIQTFRQLYSPVHQWMMHSISHPAGEEGCTVFETFELLEIWSKCVNSN